VSEAERQGQEQPGIIVPLPDMVPSSSELPPEGCPVMAGDGDKAADILYYWDYLHLDDLLNSQTPKSAERGNAVHDELFFIAVHQTSELWFKQILVELESVLTLMNQERIPERDLGVILSRLQRINAIQRLLVVQLDVLETMTPLGLTFYARTCGWTLARAHARSGDPVAIATYLGDGDAFDKSITDFSQRYADQNEQDYEDFVKAIRSGRLQAVEDV